MKISKFLSGHLVPLPHKKWKPEQKRLLRLGCAALALSLAVGAVPFMRGFAAEEEPAVSGSDIVSRTDAVVFIAEGAVEPKPAYAEPQSSGDNVTWTLDNEGTLTISGTGDMPDSPWSQYSSRIKKVVIEDGVKNIRSYAFSGCTSLTSVTIPNSVNYIGPSAFLGCNNLTSVTIPNGVETIHKEAFFDCTKLSSVDISNTVTSIGSEAFAQCKALNSVDIPDSVTSLGNNAFAYCFGLTSATLPKDLSVIPASLFF